MIVRKSTNPIRLRPATVGSILLEDEHGNPRWTVTYGVVVTSRERKIYCEDGIYTQQRQTPDGLWVYRFEGPRGRDQVLSFGLSDYQPAERVQAD